MGKNSILISYNSKQDVYTYPNDINRWFGCEFGSDSFVDVLYHKGIISKEAVNEFNHYVRQAVETEGQYAHFEEYNIKMPDSKRKWYRIGFFKNGGADDISIVVTDIEGELTAGSHYKELSRFDELTGLYNARGFHEEVQNEVLANKEAVNNGEYALVFFDVIRFKAINDIFGISEGNKVLKHIAATIRRVMGNDAIIGRPNSDHFTLFTRSTGHKLQVDIERLLEEISKYDLSFVISCNVGIYITDNSRLSVDAMIDRAVLAQSYIKGSYTKKYNYYTEALRNEMLSEQEITGMMESALQEEQFIIYYQPQYNHTTGTLVGAEALVRWNHPEIGIISPGLFIPIFEKNGFITKLDLYVFEHVCAFMKECKEKGISLVPISTNFSRNDIFQADFAEQIEAIRRKYGVESRYLRIEITESSMMSGTEHINTVINKLHDYGFLVEMDDFGTGYSSLNVLKDIDLDILKLDMLFLSTESKGNRGGIIVSTVVRMAKWMEIPIIAEGVETVQQADFLKSIGCDCIQGYLYSKPIPQPEFQEKLRNSNVSVAAPKIRIIDTLNVSDFWNPESQETLIFSNYVGAAAIFEYTNGQMEIVRVNQKYLSELRMNQSEGDLIKSDMLKSLDEENRQIYISMLERAIESMEEESCETWRNMSSVCCDEDSVCIKSSVRVIGRSDDTYLFYAMIRNVTSEKQEYKNISDSEKRFKMASEQANIYYWEYTVATRQMRPCYRCMRDLGLPELMTNYPDSAIEAGIFPPEVADMYRDWHRQIEQGAKELEAVIPLTKDRIPFRVKYTTEFDEAGHPIKAYGSATLIV